MRLFVQVGLVMVGAVVLSMNYVLITSAVSEDISTPESACFFDDIHLGEAVTAGSWQVVDMASGDILSQHESYAVFSFASVVKLVTAHIVQQKADLFTAKTTLTVSDIETEGRAGNLQVGQEYTPHELLLPLLLTSSNDAGAALQRIYPGVISDMQEFVTKLGATNTTIADTTGLSDGNRTTASDLSLVVRELYTNSPHTLDITRTPLLISRYENGWVNNIPFRSLAGYRGGKQGYTIAAKQSGVAVFNIEEIQPAAIGIVVLFSPNVAKDMETLHAAVTKSYICEFTN